MGSIARAFVAVEPPAEVVAALDERVRAVRAACDGEGLRWGDHGWHATLQFLARVDDDGALRDALAHALGAVGAPTVRLGGGGAFPSPERAKVLWLGFDVGSSEMGVLAAATARATGTLGYDTDDRVFNPHVTLARSRRLRDLRPVVAALGDDPVGPPWRVCDVVLFESTTHPDGARYAEVARIPLAS